MSNTIHLHRVIPATADKVFRAFTEADALASWIPPFGYICTVHELDERAGGKHRASFRNFTTGEAHSFGGTYLEVIPGEKLSYTSQFDDPNMRDEMRTTVTLRAVPMGTELRIEQSGIPEVIPPESCHLGWQDSLQKLAALVVPEIRQ